MSGILHSALKEDPYGIVIAMHAYAVEWVQAGTHQILTKSKSKKISTSSKLIRFQFLSFSSSSSSLSNLSWSLFIVFADSCVIIKSVSTVPWNFGSRAVRLQRTLETETWAQWTLEHCNVFPLNKAEQTKKGLPPEVIVRHVEVFQCEQEVIKGLDRDFDQLVVVDDQVLQIDQTCEVPGSKYSQAIT